MTSIDHQQIMTGLGISPNSNTKINPFIDRYVGNLDSSGSETITPLKHMSTNKLNFQASNLTPLKSPNNLSCLSDGMNANDKENKLSFTSKSPLKVKSPASFSKYKLNTSGEQIDLSHFSKEDLKYYEFLCRVAEVKRWIEQLINEDLPSEIELCVGDALRNGVFLAQMTQAINPELVPTIFPAGEKLQFKHTQNINAFFSLVENVGVPDSFRFESQDLYNKKDLPQVFETLHILITIITKKWPGKTPTLSNLSGQIGFDMEDIKKCKRAWPRIRDFKSLGKSLPNSSAVQSPFKEKPSGLINDFGKFTKPLSQTKDSMDNSFITPKKNVINNHGSYGSNNYLTSNMGHPNESVVASEPRLKSPVFISKSVASPLTDSNLNRPASIYLPTPTFKDRESFEKTPQLSYSPTKSTTLSYYSPSISKHLSYDTEFYKRRSQTRREDIEYYRSFNYSPSRYSPVRRKKMSEDEFLDNIIELQSQCRGSNTRFNIYMQDRLIGLFCTEIGTLQARSKGFLLRKKMNIPKTFKITPEESESQQKLQALLLGDHVRNHMDKLRIKSLRNEREHVRLQSIARSVVVRHRTERRLTMIQQIKNRLENLQAVIRGVNIRNILVNDKYKKDIIILQNRIRASLIRKHFIFITDTFDKETEHCIVNLQASIRSALIRNNIQNRIKTSHKYIEPVSRLSARVQGNRVRKYFECLEAKNYSSLQELNQFQGLVKGLLVRYALDLVDDIVESNNLVDLQALVRSSIVRLSLTEQANFYRRNERSVVSIQNKIKMFLQRKAYNDLMESPNPSLWSVRKYTHLLNDIGSIEGIQNKLESCQASLDAENMKKEKLQKLIRQEMDILKVLEKYGICNNTNYANQQQFIVPNSKNPSLRKLFYLLQVNPLYWKQMYENHPQFVENNIYLTFTTVNQLMGEREKVYFIRLVGELLQDQMTHADSISFVLNEGEQFWEHLLKTFLEREYASLFPLFIPVLEYLSNDTIEFESNPSVIYQQVYGSVPSSSTVPIEDSRVKEIFVANLRNLWHAIEMVAEVFTRKGQSLPIELRFICTKIFGLAADKNADEVDSLRCVSRVLIGSFVETYFAGSESFGFDKSKEGNVKAKIQTLLSALFSLFELKRFEGYFEPLNQYSDEIKPHIRDIVYSMLIGPEYEQAGDKMIYHDMSSDPPSLEILSAKAKEILKKFKDNLAQYSERDIISELLAGCTEGLNISNNGRLLLELDPSVYRFLVSDDKMRKLYDQTKRALIYMTQIENVDTNLLDLISSNVHPEDEVNFGKFLNKNGRVNEDPVIKSLDNVTYFSLKEATLVKVHELETANIVCSSDNQLQNILNDIANTIKNPYYAIDYVGQELEVTQITLEKISKLNRSLEVYLKDTKRSIEHTITSLQRSRDFVPQSKSTFGNLKSAVKKVGHKDIHELSGLKYRWTTRQLYEKGVVENIAGERLAEQTVKVFGSSGPKYPDITFKISTSDGSVFGIQLIDKRKGPEKKHSDTVDSFTFKNLLATQVGDQEKKWQLLNSKVTVDTSKLLQLIIQTFFK